MKTIVLMVVVGAVMLATCPTGGAHTDIAGHPVFTTLLFVISAIYWGTPFLLAILVSTPRVCATVCGVVGTLYAIVFICVNLLLSIAFDPAKAFYRCLVDFEIAVGAAMSPAMAASNMWDDSFTPDVRYLWFFAAAQVPIYAFLGWLATIACRAKYSKR